MNVSNAAKVEMNSSHQWQDLFERHLHVLKEHLNLWTSVQEQQPSGSNQHVLVDNCVSQTRQMISNFEQFSTSSNVPGESEKAKRVDPQQDSVRGNGSKSTSSIAKDLEETLTISPSKRRRMDDPAQPSRSSTTKQTVQDESGLFTIDSNPTPLEQLLFRASEQERPAKRSKRASGAKATDWMATSREASRQPLGLNATEAFGNSTSSVPPTTDNSTKLPAENDDSFLAKVDKRHQEREEKRKKKTDKKRKRESGDSVDFIAVSGNAKAEKREKKKLKKSNGSKPSGQGDDLPLRSKAPNTTRKSSKRGKSGGRKKKG